MKISVRTELEASLGLTLKERLNRRFQRARPERCKRPHMLARDLHAFVNGDKPSLHAFVNGDKPSLQAFVSGDKPSLHAFAWIDVGIDLPII